MGKIKAVILIDDDPINKIMCKKVLSAIAPEINVVVFTSATDGLAHIHNEYAVPAILLLDINMPNMDGWDFLDQFDTLSRDMKNLITVYLVSSSIEENDQVRPESNTNLAGFYSKPLTQSELTTILATHEIVIDST